MPRMRALTIVLVEDLDVGSSPFEDGRRCPGRGAYVHEDPDAPDASSMRVSRRELRRPAA